MYYLESYATNQHSIDYLDPNMYAAYSNAINIVDNQDDGALNATGNLSDNFPQSNFNNGFNTGY